MIKYRYYEITKQHGFADKDNHYTIEDKDGTILSDEDGNDYVFETYDEAEEFLEEYIEDNT